MGRTERPEQVQAPALRSIIRMIDMAIENGSLDASDRDEVIQMFISGPTTVVDNKAGGGMMNIDEMIRPIGMAAGGPFPPEDNVLEKLKKNDPDKELRDTGILPPLREKEGIMAQRAGLMDEATTFEILNMKLELLRAADSLNEMDRIEKLNPEEVIREFEIFTGNKGA